MNNYNDNTTELVDDAIGEVEVVKGKEEKFVRMPMKMDAYGTSSYVTDDEYAVYYEVVFHCWGRDVFVARLNVELIHARLQWNNGKNRIIEALKGLQSKGYISIDSNGEEIKATTYLTIHTPRIKSKVFDEAVVVNGTKFSNWTGVSESIMNICKLNPTKTGQRLRVLTYIAWRYKIDYSISFDEWENVLQVSERTAKRLIKSMKEEGLIDVVSGQYYTTLDGQIRQEINKYGIAKEVEEDEDAYKPTVTGRQRKFMKVAELLMATTDKRIVERSNLLDYDSKLGVEDMVIYLTSDCPIVKEYGKKRYDGISRKAKGKSMVEAWEAKARKEIANESQPSEPKISKPVQPSYEHEPVTEVEVKVNKSMVEIDTSLFDSDDDEQHAKRFRQAQQRRDAEEAKRKAEEDEKFRREMMELDEYEKEFEEASGY